MKNILLIGDSILVGSNQTSGYGTIVRDMLKDKANVYIPLDNARYTMYTLRNLAGWIDAMPRERWTLFSGTIWSGISENSIRTVH